MIIIIFNTLINIVLIYVPVTASCSLSFPAPSPRPKLRPVEVCRPPPPSPPFRGYRQLPDRPGLLTLHRNRSNNVSYMYCHVTHLRWRVSRCAVRSPGQAPPEHAGVRALDNEARAGGRLLQSGGQEARARPGRVQQSHSGVEMARGVASHSHVLILVPGQYPAQLQRPQRVHNYCHGWHSHTVMIIS